MDDVCRQIKTKFNIDPQKINLVSGAGVNINDVSKAYVDLQDNLLRQQINTINNDLLIQIGNEKTERINNDNSILQVLADLEDKKQDKLIAGEQINITADNIISAVIADANETTKGLIRIATVDEVTAGDLDNTAITPKTLANTMAPIKAIVNVDTKEFLGTANAAKKLDTARTIALAGAVTGSVLFDGSSNVSINAVLTSFDASKIASGTIDIARLPAGALDRLIQVADKIGRLALTTAQVQQGDTVQEIDTGLMFRVINDSKLNSDDGYVEYTAGRAASVPWSGITEKPTTLAKYGIVDAKIVNGTITLGGSSITPVTTHQDISSKADLDSPAFTGIPTAPTATAENSSAQLATTAFVGAAVEIKQDKLTAGTGIEIANNIISATGGGGGTGAREKKYIDLGEVRYSDVDINISEYDVFSVVPVGRIAPKIIVGAAETRVVIEWVLIVKNCNGGIVEWENNILWEGGIAPELTTSDIIEFFSYDKGKTWYASKKTDFLNVYDSVWSYQLLNNKAVLKYLGNGAQKVVVPNSVNGYKSSVNGSTFYGINDYVVDVSAVDFSDTINGYGFFTENWGDGFAATAKEIIGIKMPNVTDFGRAFSGNGYLVNANTIIVGDKLVEVQGMYDGCSKLTVGVTMNTSKVSNFHQMYAGCPALTTVPVLDTAKGTVMRNMFDGCKSLPATFPWSIDLKAMTPALASNRDGLTNMFAGSSVKTVKFRNVQVGTAQYLTAAVLGTQLTSIIIENKI